MPVLAFGIIWGGYTLFMLGWATIKDYEKDDHSRINLGDLVSIRNGGYTGPWGKVGNAKFDPNPSGTTNGKPNGPGNCPTGLVWDGKQCVKVLQA